MVIFFCDRIVIVKIAIVAGGTGGHIYPALTLAEGLKERGHDITFIGSNDRMEKDVIPQAGFAYIGLDVYTTKGGLGQKAKSLLSICDGYRKSLKLLKGYDMAIGFGNYISIPVMLAAVKLQLKTVIHEQNSFVGRANRILDKKMDLVIGSYEEDKQQFKNPHTLILGNPQISKALDIRKDPEVLREYGLNPEKKTVVIFMGSLGSATVNEKLMDYFELLDGSYQVLYATGRYNYALVKEKVKETSYLKCYERIDGLKAMANSDLLVSRAGATTLCEISAIGMPSILIPSPFVPNNHQYYNGLSLAQRKAAIMIEEKDLNAQLLNDTINELIHDDEKLKQMGELAKNLANRNVLNDIIDEVEKL